MQKYNTTICDIYCFSLFRVEYLNSHPPVKVGGFLPKNTKKTPTPITPFL